MAYIQGVPTLKTQIKMRSLSDLPNFLCRHVTANLDISPFLFASEYPTGEIYPFLNTAIGNAVLTITG